MSSVIKKAIISEKSFKEAAQSKFTFLVDRGANKDSIAFECEKLFGVNVLSVNTTNYKGKIKLTRRIKGARSNFKKALVTLKSGQKIDLFEIEEPEEDKKKTKAKEKSEGNKEVETVIKKKGKTINE